MTECAGLDPVHHDPQDQAGQQTEGERQHRDGYPAQESS
jgi:hypothetical protein